MVVVVLLLIGWGVIEVGLGWFDFGEFFCNEVVYVVLMLVFILMVDVVVFEGDVELCVFVVEVEVVV